MNALKSLIHELRMFSLTQSSVITRREIENIVCKIYQIPWEKLISFHGKRDSKLDSLCWDILKKASQGEPLAYLFGEVDFYDVSIKVNKHVLIPRMETEWLLDLVVCDLTTQVLDSEVLFEPCTGSGCLSIALKKKFPKLKIIASDICSKALDIAKENARINQVDIDFRQGDFFNVLEETERVDYCVCNPPYISVNEWELLDVAVKDYEPYKALVAPNGGEYFYKRLACILTKEKRIKKKIWLEIGYNQGESLKSLFDTTKWGSVDIKKDLSGNDRLILLESE